MAIAQLVEILKRKGDDVLALTNTNGLPDSIMRKLCSKEAGFF